MDDQQTRRINEAAQQFTEVLVESYRTATERAVSTQQLNTELTQNFFDGVINNLRAQAESNREMIRELVDQQQRQQEAAQALAQESANAYVEFLESTFFFHQRSVEETGRGAGEAGSSVEEAERGAGEAESLREELRNIVRESVRRSAREA